MADQELAKKDDAPLAVFDYGDAAGAGYENQTAEDRAMQFISIIQALSPQLDESHAAFIEDAKVGDLFNTVTNELIPQGAEFIPAITEHVYVEWVPRSEGGGFVARHALDSPVVAKAKASYKFGEWKTEAGNDLIETFYLFGVLILDGTLTPAVIAFSKTKIKVYKSWNTKTLAFQVQTEDGRRQTPPLFAHRVALGSVNDQNPKGKFKNFSLAPAEGTLGASLIRDLNDVRFLAGQKIHDMVMSGTAKVDYSQQDGGGEVGEEDVPF